VWGCDPSQGYFQNCYQAQKGTAKGYILAS
jgi:hypothetical protein